MFGCLFGWRYKIKVRVAQHYPSPSQCRQEGVFKIWGHLAMVWLALALQCQVINLETWHRDRNIPSLFLFLFQTLLRLLFNLQGFKGLPSTTLTHISKCLVALRVHHQLTAQKANLVVARTHCTVSSNSVTHQVIQSTCCSWFSFALFNSVVFRWSCVLYTPDLNNHACDARRNMRCQPLQLYLSGGGTAD